MRKIILLLLLLSTVSAQEFDYYNLEISLTSSGLAHQKIENIFILDKETNDILFSINQDIENIKVPQNEFTFTEQGILIHKNIKPDEKNLVEIEFDTKDLVKQSGSNFIFSMDFSLPFVSKNTQIKLNLPEGFILSDIDPPASPKPTVIETDGKIISLIWKNPEEESFIVVYKRGFTDKSESAMPTYLVFIALLIIIFTAILFMLTQKRKTREFISSTLSENENIILNIIRKEKNITQKKIGQITGFSKSKLSKIIKRLEEKNILKRKPFFKTNKFELSKKMK
ncbi:winged helix-turn-helix transcriptional regulator [Candidatus Pacearchaeota archaeon]|nr:winged helix-turn-helix transcriptional regulator [Candidatus Pacearchaeota archaeon]